jgi:hypothetical protein
VEGGGLAPSLCVGVSIIAAKLRGNNKGALTPCARGGRGRLQRAVGLDGVAAWVRREMVSEALQQQRRRRRSAV